MKPRVLGLALVAWAFAAHAQVQHPDYVPSAPGTYTLPPIQRAPNGVVVDSNGTRHSLARYTTERITLLSFIYTYCTDPAGCPLAYETFVAVRNSLLERPEIARRIRLVSLSFDPTHDTPDVLRAYGGEFAAAKAGPAWSFLTTQSVKTLLPLLEGFGQEVSVERDADGRPQRTINHALKVFLIDRRGMVREIYSTAFLFPEVVLNDIQTLLMEEGVKVNGDLSAGSPRPVPPRAL